MTPRPQILFFENFCATDNPSNIKTLLHNGLSTFLVFINGPRSLPRDIPD